jgi:hypothetical protein
MRKTELSGWNFSNEDRTPVASISLIEQDLVAACRAAFWREIQRFTGFAGSGFSRLS